MIPKTEKSQKTYNQPEDQTVISRFGQYVEYDYDNISASRPILTDPFYNILSTDLKTRWIALSSLAENYKTDPNNRQVAILNAMMLLLQDPLHNGSSSCWVVDILNYFISEKILYDVEKLEIIFNGISLFFECSGDVDFDWFKFNWCDGVIISLILDVIPQLIEQHKMEIVNTHLGNKLNKSLEFFLRHVPNDESRAGTMRESIKEVQNMLIKKY